MGGGASKKQPVRSAPGALEPAPSEAASPDKAKAPSGMFGGLFKTGMQSMKNPFVKKEEEPPKPLTTWKEVVKNAEALQRVKDALVFAPPGTVFRWNKILQAVNRVEPVVDPNNPPLVLSLTEAELKLALSFVYDNVNAVNSDGIVLMRDAMPKLYDKHSVERGRRVSQADREKNGMSDECFSYGELDYEIFASIYSKVSAAYGVFKEGCFYDLGSGVGTLVFAAALAGQFIKCAGIENVEALHERGRLREIRWKTLKQHFPRRFREIEMEFIHDNFFHTVFQIEATFVVLHWTAFSLSQRETVSNTLEMCREGTICVSFTYPLCGEAFEILKEDTCETSWGVANYFVQEKLTPARAPA